MQLKNREMRSGRGKVCSDPCQKAPYACFMGHSIPALDHAIRTTPHYFLGDLLNVYKFGYGFLVPTFLFTDLHIMFMLSLGDQTGEVYVYHFIMVFAFISRHAQPANHLIPDRRNYWLFKWQFNASLDTTRRLESMWGLLYTLLQPPLLRTASGLIALGGDLQGLRPGFKSLFYALSAIASVTANRKARNHAQSSCPTRVLSGYLPAG